MQACLACGRQACDLHHWPKTRRYGDVTVPLCRVCHAKMHSGDRDVTARVIAKAETYWRQTGQWALAKPLFEAYMAKREYIAATSK
jgi:hypothetical protein